MKNTFSVILTIAFCIFTNSSIISQNYCGTKENSSLFSSNDIHVGTLNYDDDDDEFCIKVYIHNVKESNGSGGVATSVLNLQVDKLNELFHNSTNSGIDFIWDTIILDIEDDDAYNFDNGPLPLCVAPSFNVFDNYSHTDGIDMYFFDRPLFHGSAADGIAGETQIAISSSHPTTKVIAHEMGHALGLFHLWHSFPQFSGSSYFCENDGGYSNHVPECINASQSQRDVSGDYVADTEAQPSPGLPPRTTECWGSYEGEDDTCGDEYDITEIANLMNYNGSFMCFMHFTPLQMKRMKYSINTFSSLQSTLASSCDEVECCDIQPYFSPTHNECEVSFVGTDNGFGCSNRTFSWTVDGVPVGTQQNLTYNFPSSGGYQVCYKICSGNPGLGPQCCESYCRSVVVHCNKPGLSPQVSKIQIHPNPISSDNKWLTLSGVSNEFIKQIDIFNFHGVNQISLEQLYDNQINITKLSVGVYFVKVTAINGEVIVKRLLVN